MQSNQFDRLFKTSIAFLLLVFLFLFYRSTENSGDTQRFQFFYNSDRGAMFLTDTKTGEIYSGSSLSGDQMVWVKLNPRTAEHSLVKSQIE